MVLRARYRAVIPELFNGEPVVCDDDARPAFAVFVGRDDGRTVFVVRDAL